MPPAVPRRTFLVACTAVGVPDTVTAIGATTTAQQITGGMTPMRQRKSPQLTRSERLAQDRRSDSGVHAKRSRTHLPTRVVIRRRAAQHARATKHGA